MTDKLKMGLHAAGITILLFLLGGSIFFNSFLNKKVEEQNSLNDSLYSEIEEAIPTEEIERLVDSQKKILKFEDQKTSFSIYEIWELLSRIIPVSSNTKELTIDQKEIEYSYVSSNFQDHLTFLNTLDLLKGEKVIKDYKSEKIEEQVENKTFTYYKTSIELNIGADFYRGVRDKKPILDTGSNEGLLVVQQIREFLLKKDKGEYIKQFLNFNK